ncbi:MAG: hypothetical protein AAF990_25235 [Bacteroidota bacterium]
MENKDNLLSVLQTLFKWKKQIIGLCVITLIGTVVVSLFLSNYYESTTLFYAANPDLAKPPSVGSEIKDRNYYGQTGDIDRVLAIAQSDEIAAYLIDKFNLYEHYGVDTSHVKAPFFVRKKFYNAYTVTKTKYDAIELKVEDKDPRIAADMVNAARDKVEDIARSLAKQSQAEQIRDYESRISDKERELSILSDSLERVRTKYKIYNSYSQSEILSELYENAETNLANANARLEALKSFRSIPRDSVLILESKVKGFENQISTLNNRLDTFNIGMGKVRLLVEIYNNASRQIGVDKERYKQIKGTYNSNFVVIFLLEKGRVSVIKSRPKRSLIVIGAVFIAFIVGIMGVLLFDTYKGVNWREIING